MILLLGKQQASNFVGTLCKNTSLTPRCAQREADVVGRRSLATATLWANGAAVGWKSGSEDKG